MQLSKIVLSLTISNTKVTETTKTLVYIGYQIKHQVSASYFLYPTLSWKLFVKIWFSLQQPPFLLWFSLPFTYQPIPCIIIRSVLFLSKHSLHMICHKQGKLTYNSMNLLKTRAMVNSVKLQEFFSSSSIYHTDMTCCKSNIACKWVFRDELILNFLMLITTF